MSSNRFDWDWDREWDRWEEERRLHEAWNRSRGHDRERIESEQPWRPENQGVQSGSGTFGGTNYGGVVGNSAWGGGAERYSITDPYANEWYVKQLKKGRHTGVGPASYKRADSRIREDVCDRLAYHPEIDASGIEVAVTNGEVMLTGLVGDRRTKWAIEDVAEHVFGVKGVNNEIRVSREASTGRTDAA